MKKYSDNRRIAVMGGLLFTMISVLIFIILSNDCPSGYEKEYFVLLGCHIFLCICLICEVTKKDSYIFEPIYFVMFLYWMIFVFTPIMNMINDEMDIFGVNTMNGCIKGTVIFIVGFMSLLVGYHFRFTFGNKKKNITKEEKLKKVEYDEKSLLHFSYILWVLMVGLYLLYNMMVGRNPIYMLSFGILSNGLGEKSGFSVDFMSMLIYISFVPMMNILIHEKSKIIKFIIFYVTCVPMATRGFRSALIVPIVAPFIYHYLKDRKKPSFKMMIIALLCFVFVFGLVGSARGSNRAGNGLDLSSYEYSDGLEGILDYFGSYKVYYGAVMNYPKNYHYTYGGQLIYTVLMYIPRFIWPGKPFPLIYEAISNSVSGYASEAGSAWPNIGEYYTDGGVLGVAVCMLILGIFLRRMKNLYENSYGSRTLAYSVLLPGLVMIIAYGYTAGNLPAIVFMFLPLLGEKYFVKHKRINN